jgi:hypothetical protein
MATGSAGWLRCSSCKGDIDFEQTYYVCSVSTCNRAATNLRFCSVECWDAHVPVMRHRDAWAEEKRSPSRAEWERAEAPSGPAAAAPRREPAAAKPGEPTAIEWNDGLLPEDVLVVASKLKAYIRARAGLNTSDAVVEVLSRHLRRVCDEGIRNAAGDGRKTVLDRDFRWLDEKPPGRDET